ncbi:MAG: hypothetical protein ABIH70_10035 [Chloroflexota bacterium]
MYRRRLLMFLLTLVLVAANFAWGITPAQALDPLSPFTDGAPTSTDNETMPRMGQTTQADRQAAADRVKALRGQTASFSTSSPQLIGTGNVAATSGESPGYFLLDKYTASATGTVTNIGIKAIRGGNVKVAIYSDNAGQPGDLLAAVNTDSPVVAGWNSIPITATPVTLGTVYWLAYISDTPSIYYYINPAPGSESLYKATPYAGFSFPASAGTGFTSWKGYHIIAGW